MDRGSPLENSEFLNPKIALGRLANNRELYARLLRIFLKNYSGLREQIQILVNENNLIEFRQVIHSLVGSAGAIGANKLQTQAFQLEDEYLIHNQAPSREIVDDFLSIADLSLEYVQEEVKKNDGNP